MKSSPPRLLRRISTRSCIVAVAVAGAATLVVAPISSARHDNNRLPARHALDTVKYVDAGQILVDFPRLEAEAQGYFTKYGIELNNVSSVFNAALLGQAVAQGDADIGITGGTGPLPLAAAGRPIKVIGIGAAPAALQISLNNAAMDKLAAKGVTAKSSFKAKMEALKGMKIASAASGSTTFALFTNTLRKVGLNPDKDLTILPLGTADAVTAAVRQGTADGLVGFPLQSTQPQAEGWGKIFVDFLHDSPKTVDIPWTVVIANADWLAKNRAVAVRVLKAMQLARRDSVNFTPAKSATLKSMFFASTTDVAYQAGVAAALPAMKASLIPSRDRAALVLEVYNNGNPNPVNVDYSTLYDPSLAKQAIAELTPKKVIVLTRVNVTATDAKVKLAKPSVKAGTKVTFHVINNGKVAHVFAIAGKKSAKIKPHGSANLTATFLKKGTFKYSWTGGKAMTGSFAVT